MGGIRNTCLMYYREWPIIQKLMKYSAWGISRWIHLALSECARVLRVGGRFSAGEPWKAPLHTIGTNVFGKREPSVHCKPLTKKRIESLYTTFPKACTRQHGTLFRYPLLAMSKLGINTSLQTAWCINCVDDALCSLVPGLRSWGSSIAVLGEK